MNDDKQARFTAARDALLASLSLAEIAVRSGNSITGDVGSALQDACTEYTHARIAVRPVPKVRVPA